MEQVATEPTTALDVLRLTRERLAKRNAWCQGAFARTPDYQHTQPCNPAAVSWCLLGAMEAVCCRVEAEGSRYELRKAACNALAGVLPARYGNDIAGYNDEERRQKTTILKLLTKGIAYLETRGL